MTNKKISRKILFALAVTVLSAVILLPAAAAIIYWHTVKTNPAVQDLTGAVLTPSGSVPLGDTVTASVLLKFPWHRHPTEAAAEIGKGATMLAEPVMTRQQWGIGYSVWKISVEMRPYHTGMIAPGKLDVKFNRYDAKTAGLGMDCRIPEFQALPLDNAKGSELLVADRLPDPGIAQKRTLWTLALILAGLLIAAALYCVFRKRHEGPVMLTPWECALLELAELRNGFRQGRINMEPCFVRLTDIVRQYLGKRFRIHAPQQTTYEFLAELNKPGGALPEDQRHFLREFMTVADLVKFAKLPPDEHLLSVALDKAELLVSETRPADELNKKGDAK
ncbi:MAG: hypothetical protein ACYC4Q_02835 [Victivallaceae bacterium]